MTQQAIKELFDKKEAEPKRDREDEVVLEIREFINHFSESLPKDESELFEQLVKSFLKGGFALTSYRRRNESAIGKLWVTKQSTILMQEPNKFLRVLNSLDLLLTLGFIVHGSDKTKECISGIINAIANQPLIKALRCVDVDHVECWLLMNLIFAHFEDREISKLTKSGYFKYMPNSYLGRISLRIAEGRSALVNEGFITTADYGNLNYLLFITPKTLSLLVNPYQYDEQLKIEIKN
jgi:hypothetical protein